MDNWRLFKISSGLSVWLDSVKISDRDTSLSGEAVSSAILSKLDVLAFSISENNSSTDLSEPVYFFTRSS